MVFPCIGLHIIFLFFMESRDLSVNRDCHVILSSSRQGSVGRKHTGFAQYVKDSTRNLSIIIYTQVSTDSVSTG